MSDPNPYTSIMAVAMQQFRDQEAAAAKPRLHLVTPNTPPAKNTKTAKPRKAKMKTPTRPDEKANSDDLQAIIRETFIDPVSLCNLDAFQDLQAAAKMIVMGAEALAGLGAMMRPGMTSHDEDLGKARRSDVSAIFRFIGSALKGPANACQHAAERLERAAQGETR
jgi:hypothetical protein